MGDPIVINGATGDTAITATAFGDNNDGEFDQSVAKGSSVAVLGRTDVGIGINGESPEGAGVCGNTKAGFGVVGDCLLAGSGTGTGTGVLGRSKTGRGVWGQSDSFIATVGDSKTGTGIWGHSLHGTGVYGEGVPAGHFQGNVEVNGDISCRDVTCHDVTLTGGQDCAEDFDISTAASVSPGTVMVIDDLGLLEPSREAYDRRVAGVVSGAGSYKPGIVLDKRPSKNNRLPIALVGKVYCRVDAQYSPIAMGDLLTTSPTTGHAMKAADPSRASGAVIGKALGSLASGQGLLAILIALQ
jgi:hypothetical protein